MAAFFDPNELGGNQINEPFNGLGDYTPFVGNSGLPRNLTTGNGGGGGGQYIPPVQPNPIFVPPSVVQQNLGTFNISLLANEIVQFLENDVNIGTGESQVISFSPSLTFGNLRTYKTLSNGRTSLNYYEVSIEKKYTQITPSEEDGGDVVPNFLRFRNKPTNIVGNQTPTALSRLYDEIIKIKEYTLQPNNTYIITNERNLNSTNGSINLEFRLSSDVAELPPAPMVTDLSVDFVSNLPNELGDFVKLNYQLASVENDLLISDSIMLSDGNTDTNTIESNKLRNGYLNFEIQSFPNPTAKISLGANGLPIGYEYREFYWAPKSIAEKNSNNFSVWNKVLNVFRVNGNEASDGIVVAVIFEKNVKVNVPEIILGKFNSEFEIKESESEKEIVIPFAPINADGVDVYISPEKKLRIPAVDGFIRLFFNKDFNGVFGRKKIYILPFSNQYGTGVRTECLINFIAVNDFPSIIQITAPETIDIPSFSDLNIEFEVSYESFAVTSVDVDILLKDKTRTPLFTSLPNNGTFKINLKTISKNYSGWNGSETLNLIFKPINNAGSKKLIGNEYEVITNISYSPIKLDEDIIKTAIFDAFKEHLRFVEPEPDSKFLTHLANFSNDEHILISSWETDNWTLSEKIEDELGNQKISKQVDSIILKLYSPLPADIVVNSTFWITKLMTNPLIETVILSEQNNIECPPIKGPNFGIDFDYIAGNSIGFESLDNLIFSAPTTTSLDNLVQTYVTTSLFNTDDLNIKYYDGTIYLTGSIIWNNFVNFSSAKERVDNFVYKVQLIEAYEELISSSINSPIYSVSINEKNELSRQKIKKEKIIQGFDGFEKFLYTPAYQSESLYTNSGSNSITWPYSGSIRLASNTLEVNDWYTNIVNLAEDYDSINKNFIKNNIPEYILINTENQNFLLLLSLLGQHFDTLYFTTKSIEKSRGLGYKAKNTISDRLIFDTLKSFGWDAKSLSYDNKLWEYALGLNNDGAQVETNPAKKRTYELWRRIINNLPYLLKQKGTRKGIYALLSCYGIPSSNLSILEFGGPEPAGDQKGKLVMDSLTNVLKFNTGSAITVNWNTTDKGTKANTIELFVKPSYARDWTLLSGSNWNVGISGSTDSKYGKVIFNYTNSNQITSSLIPIFNDRFFGISVSSGSTGLKLDVAQTTGERLIFSQSITSSNATNWNTGTSVKIGDGNFSGSVEEFRMWSDVLDTERFIEHTFYPEMINGNHISSSTQDLYFRLDFEYPKNVNTNTTLISVDPNIYFSGSLNRNDYEIDPTLTFYSLNSNATFTASCSGFTSVTSYPYQFEVIDRTVVLEIPDLGASRYITNKVRFESQYDLDGSQINSVNGIDLSVKSRATIKSLDNAPMDSNRVGLFFSPNKELNFDIAKSMGGINLDNYIADPSNRYSDKYKSLDKLRNYYFKRINNRDIYEYINIIKLYEKAMFEDIKKMLPARVKATTGLLIEPHFLERSKYQYTKPKGENNQFDSNITYSDFVDVIATNNQYQSVLDTELYKTFNGENNQYESKIDKPIDELIGESYQQISTINAELKDIAGNNFQYESKIPTDLYKGTQLSEFKLADINVIAGQNSISELGSSLYAEEGYTIRLYRDKDGNLKKERVRVDILTNKKYRYVLRPIQTVNGVEDPRSGQQIVLEEYTENEINIQPFDTAKVIGPGTGSVVASKPLTGYLPNHYKNKGLPTGLQNSYFKGAKNTSATTLDGTAPVETFATNPNILKVGRANRDNTEPILET